MEHVQQCSQYNASNTPEGHKLNQENGYTSLNGEDKDRVTAKTSQVGRRSMIPLFS
ncbi:hypothetical protein CY34DRAFT_627053 [Suillus luteus UH-Slu-Lm8-n1]|uniref:Uncharacterized protein n=1 Tax=Suillus luteus UH-Slu-Lm8-n1 TaxID=930992 RepID=A0A0D0BFQ6_9AGAM|nr:hypothetical protein CY34DRAFT_627053 [Suillus luteus UH-Slu-Lm8-n1]